jgi:hypothetical protein
MVSKKDGKASEKTIPFAATLTQSPKTRTQEAFLPSASNPRRALGVDVGYRSINGRKLNLSASGGDQTIYETQTTPRGDLDPTLNQPSLTPDRGILETKTSKTMSSETKQGFFSRLPQMITGGKVESFPSNLESKEGTPPTPRPRGFSLIRKETSETKEQKLERLESKVTSKLISINLNDYDKKYLENSLPREIKQGLNNSKEVSLSFPGNKLFKQNKSDKLLMNALCDFIATFDHNDNAPVATSNLILKDITELSLSNRKILREALKYCDLRADSGFRRAFNDFKHSMLVKMQFMDYNEPLKELRIEIENAKISRVCSVEVHWTYKGKEIITPIAVEYIANLGSQPNNNQARIVNINWVKKEKINKKIAFLSMLENCIEAYLLQTTSQ